MKELEIVTELILEAGRMLTAEAARPEGPRGQGMKAPIDEEIEDLFMRELRRHFPDDAVITEERGGRRGRSGRAFIIDPHDGTRDFLLGRRETSISVALVEEGRFLLGAVHAPMATEMTGPEGILLTWGQGQPVRSHGEPFAPPPPVAELGAQSRVLVSANLEPRYEQEDRRRLAPASMMACPSIATRFVLVALGQADGGYTLLNPLADWDFAGAQALLQAVGGDVYGPDGRPVRWDGLASSPQAVRGYFAARHPAVAAHLAGLFADVTGG